MLIGRKYLQACKAQINYIEDCITLGSYTFYFKYEDETDHEKGIEQKQFDPIITNDPDINFAINNEISEKNEYRLDHLNPEETEKLKKVLFEFSDIQYREGEKLTFTSTIKHSIHTKHEGVIYKKPYKYPQTFDQEVNKQIQEMIEQGIIRKSKSPYCSPIWIVPKKPDASNKQKYRLVIDYRDLNEITIDDKFPIPLMDEILDKENVSISKQLI